MDFAKNKQIARRGDIGSLKFFLEGGLKGKIPFGHKGQSISRAGMGQYRALLDKGMSHDQILKTVKNVPSIRGADDFANYVFKGQGDIIQSAKHLLGGGKEVVLTPGLRRSLEAGGITPNMTDAFTGRIGLGGSTAARISEAGFPGFRALKDRGIDISEALSDRNTVLSGVLGVDPVSSSGVLGKPENLYALSALGLGAGGLGYLALDSYFGLQKKEKDLEMEIARQKGQSPNDSNVVEAEWEPATMALAKRSCLSKAMSKLAQDNPGLFDRIWDGTKSVAGRAGDALSSGAGAVGNAVSGAGSAIGSGFSPVRRAFGGAGRIIGGGLDLLGGATEKALGAFGGSPAGEPREGAFGRRMLGLGVGVGGALLGRRVLRGALAGRGFRSLAQNADVRSIQNNMNAALAAGNYQQAANLGRHLDFTTRSLIDAQPGMMRWAMQPQVQQGGILGQFMGINQPTMLSRSLGMSGTGTAYGPQLLPHLTGTHRGMGLGQTLSQTFREQPLGSAALGLLGMRAAGSTVRDIRGK